MCEGGGGGNAVKRVHDTVHIQLYSYVSVPKRNTCHLTIHKETLVETHTSPHPFLAYHPPLVTNLHDAPPHRTFRQVQRVELAQIHVRFLVKASPRKH